MPSENIPLAELPPIPAKRYFTIGEVSELCMVKPHVLRYWEQEFGQLRPVKRRGNRRYYQHHEVLLVRRIRELLYGEGFTIIGARGRLDEEANGTQPLTRRRGAVRLVHYALLHPPPLQPPTRRLATRVGVSVVAHRWPLRPAGHALR